MMRSLGLTTGYNNTAAGAGALASNTTGFANTAVGSTALFNNTGYNNTAVGSGALYFNTTGSDNTATGFEALFNNTTGSDNTASGHHALHRNRTGNNNTASGNDALFNNTGSSNIALGFQAGKALTTGSHNIDIGNIGFQAESNTIRIGTTGTQTATFIAGISGATVPTGVAVIVDANGHLGTITSSERFKEEIQPMDKASEAILALRPVTFRYKQKLDPEKIPQFGLVAEDVGKVNPDLVARDKDGKPYTVRYEAVNAMLLNEFLKEHRTVEQLEKQVAALTAGLQKVTDQLEASKSVPQVVLNNQ
jgi:trimeric autotransporter adhesin